MATQDRPERATEERRERRRRTDGSLDRMTSFKMAIPQSVSDKYADRDFRWFNDVGNRIHAKTELDDWDKVPNVEPLTVGTDGEGKPIKAYLCMKPKEFVREDNAAKEAMLKEQEKGMLRGPDNADLAGVSYAVEGNSIRRGSR